MLNFIVNPNARKGKIKKLLGKMEERLKEEGAGYRIFYSGKEGDLRKYAEALSAAGEKYIIAVGGDGSLNEVLNGLTDPANTVLGLVPAGTGNDFAAFARIPQGLAALDLILHGEPRPVDYLQCGGMRSINIAGLGIDADILRRCRKMKGTQKGKYFRGLLASLCKFKAIRIKTRVEGGEWTEYSTFIAAACNGGHFGGGIPFCPEAVIDDGKMEFVVVDCPKRIKIPIELVRLMRGKLMKQKIAHRVTCTEAEIVPEKREFAQFDGELREIDSLHIQVVTGKLHMFRG